MKRRTVCLSALAALFSFAACSLPENVVKDAKGAGQQAEGVVKELKAALDAYRIQAQTEEFRFFRPFAEREDWENTLADAVRLATSAKYYWTKEVQPLLKKNDEDDAGKVRAAVTTVRNRLKAAQNKAKIPEQRQAFILKAKREAPQIVAKAKTHVESADSLVSALKKQVDKVKADHQKKAADLDRRLAGIKRKLTQSQSLYRSMETVLENAKADRFADYALVGDGGKQINTYLAEIATADKALRKRMDSLYQAYSKTLTDMRVDCYVQIGRSSWDSSDDYDNTPDHLYAPRQVPCQTADYFAKLGEGALATYGTSWGGWSLSVKCDTNAWNQLKIAPKEAWPASYDDESEFWLNDVSNRFYHKYLIVKNKQKQETDWVEVEEEEFAEYEDCLGMDIEAKPYGTYEDEALEEPMPPGMAYVGDERYGRWERDEHGNRFWTFLGYYAFFNMMLGPHRYGYGEYDRWNRDYRGRRGYYGRTGNGRSWRYGTRGTVTKRSSRMKRSSFARRGGFRRSGASIRGAGRSARGGGPGGGGK